MLGSSRSRLWSPKLRETISQSLVGFLKSLIVNREVISNQHGWDLRSDFTEAIRGGMCMLGTYELQSLLPLLKRFKL